MEPTAIVSCYKDDEKILNDIEEITKPKKRSSVPYGLLALVGILSVIVGFGGGFGAGWAAHQPSDSSNSQNTAQDNPVILYGETDNVDLLQTYVPVDYTGNIDNEAVRLHYQQSSVINRGLRVLAFAINALSGNTITTDAAVLSTFIFKRYQNNQDTLAKLYDVSQRIQVSVDFELQLYNITSGLADVFDFIRDNLGKVGGSSRRLAASDTSENLEMALLRSALTKALDSPKLSDAAAKLKHIWPGGSDLVDLVMDILAAVRDVAAQDDGVGVEAVNSLGDVMADQETQEIDLGQAGSRRRQLPEVNQLPLPSGFTPLGPDSRPRLLVPLAFHFMAYSNADGSFGPPGLTTACTMAARLVYVANYFLPVANVKLFISACYNDPVARPYLLKPTREAWLACTSAGYFYKNCPEAITDHVVDLPRTINIFVSGEGSSPLGYGFSPPSTWKPTEGHVWVLWDIVNTAVFNNRDKVEKGAFIFIHEILHHLGLSHTFSSVCGADGDGISDTPTTLSLYSQTWQAKAAYRCQLVWAGDLKANFETVANSAATRIGIPPQEINTAFDSCPSQPNTDELSNYMTYTYPECSMPLGHLTTGQVARMHEVSATSNPTLYQWAQYYAANPPAGVEGFGGSSSPSSSPPPPPAVVAFSPPPPSSGSTPVPTPTATTCASRTAGGCKCASSWTFRKGTYSDCESVPRVSDTGLVCAIDTTSGDCASLRNSWWDYCTKATDCSGGAQESKGLGVIAQSTSTGSPTTSPTVSCGRGAPTKSGKTCTMANWQVRGSRETYVGCANPNNDPKGVWCVVASSDSTKARDYCLDACNS